jgi:hypothetical protein
VNESIVDWRLPIANWPQHNRDAAVRGARTEAPIGNPAIGNWQWMSWVTNGQGKKGYCRNRQSAIGNWQWMSWVTKWQGKKVVLPQSPITNRQSAIANRQ